MSFSYQVILRPTDVRFSAKRIPAKFNNGIRLQLVVDEIKQGKKLAKDIPAIQVVWCCERWQWYALNNRRLWVFQQLEILGTLTYVAMSRVELIDVEHEHPAAVHKEVELYEPDWDVNVLNNNLCVGLSEGSKLDALNVMSKLAQPERVTDESFAVAALSDKKRKATQTDSLPSVTGASKGVVLFESGSEAQLAQPSTKSDVLVEDCSKERRDVENITLKGKISDSSHRASESCASEKAAFSRAEPEGRCNTSDHQSGNPGHEFPDKEIARKKEMRSIKSVVTKPKPEERRRSVCDARRKLSASASSCKSDLSSWSSLSSTSSISRAQRVLAPSAGLSSYGYFHVYFTEYLNKIRTAREDSLRRYRPYSLTSSRSQLPLRKLSAGDISVDRLSILSSSRGSVTRELRELTLHDKASDADESVLRAKDHDRKRCRSPWPESDSDDSDSGESHASGRGRYNRLTSSTDLRASIGRSRSGALHPRVRLSSDDMRYTFTPSTGESLRVKTEPKDEGRSAAQRELSQNDFEQGEAKSFAFADLDEYRRSYKCSQESSSVMRKHSQDSASSHYVDESLESVRFSGVRMSELYETWERRRAEYLLWKLRNRGKEDAALDPYICGICFKRFKHIVDLQQHCESLMHYACITCGRFFGSYAALGQHCKELAHQKD